MMAYREPSVKAENLIKL